MWKKKEGLIRFSKTAYGQCKLRNLKSKTDFFLFFRIMGALWISLDNVNSGTTTAESSICIHIPWMDGWDFVLGDRSSGHFLLLQSHLSSSRAPRSVRPSTSSLQRHGSWHFRYIFLFFTLFDIFCPLFSLLLKVLVCSWLVKK